MVGTTVSDMTEKVGITLPISLVKRADKARGDIPRSMFIRRAIEQFLITAAFPIPLEAPLTIIDFPNLSPSLLR
jgi:hypothetical protein